MSDAKGFHATPQPVFFVSLSFVKNAAWTPDYSLLNPICPPQVPPLKRLGMIETGTKAGHAGVRQFDRI